MATLTRHELKRLAVHGVIRGETLRRADVSRGSLRTMLRREHLFRVHEDVFCVAEEPTREGRWLAAAWRCGAHALVSHWSAAVLWRLIDEGGDLPNVTVPQAQAKHPPRGIRVHRTRRPDPGWVRDGIPVTTLYRTIDDVSRGLAPSSLKAAVGRAERFFAADLAELYAATTARRLKDVLASYVAGRGLTDSELEARFYEIADGTSIGSPERQRRQPGGRVDFVWPALNLVVEVDGYGTHRGRVAFHEDRRRDRANWRAGLTTLRFTWDDVVLTPRDVADDLEHAGRAS
jgi:hypothetical protein